MFSNIFIWCWDFSAGRSRSSKLHLIRASKVAIEEGGGGGWQTTKQAELPSWEDRTKMTKILYEIVGIFGFKRRKTSVRSVCSELTVAKVRKIWYGRYWTLGRKKNSVWSVWEDSVCTVLDVRNCRFLPYKILISLIKKAQVNVFT